MKRRITTICAALLIVLLSGVLAFAQINSGPKTTATPSTWWENTGRKSPGDIGDTAPASGTFSPNISKGKAAITSFTGTVSSSGATVTFSAAADAVLAGYDATNAASGLGTTIVAAGQTRYITAWTNSTTCTVSSAPSPAWGAGTAITSVQEATAVFVGPTGTVLGWVLPGGTVYLLGNVGIGATTAGAKLHISGGVSATSDAELLLGIGNGSASDTIQSIIGMDNTDNYLKICTGNVLGTNTKVAMDTSGNIGMNTTDFDGTPAVGKLTVKSSTNNGSTYPFVLRDSDEANLVTVDSNGNVYTVADVSALTFTDRTPNYEGDALAELAAIKSKDGEIDHATLPAFVQKPIRRAYEVDAEEISVADAFEEVDVEEQITETDSEGKQAPKVLSKQTKQQGYKFEAGQVVPNMVEDTVYEIRTKKEKRLKTGLRFDEATGKIYRREVRYEEEPGRDLGAMISVLTKAVQQLTEEVNVLKGK